MLEKLFNKSSNEKLEELYESSAEPILSKIDMEKPEALWLGEYKKKYGDNIYLDGSDGRFAEYIADTNTIIFYPTSFRMIKSEFLRNFFRSFGLDLPDKEHVSIHETVHSLAAQKNPNLKKYMTLKPGDLSREDNLFFHVFNEGFATWYTSKINEWDSERVKEYKRINDCMRDEKILNGDDYLRFKKEKPYILGYEIFEKMEDAFGDERTEDIALSLSPTKNSINFVYEKACKALGIKPLNIEEIQY